MVWAQDLVTEQLKPYFEEHMDQWKKLYDIVYEKLKQKSDPYVKSFEEMLGIDVGERFGINMQSNIEEL